MHQTKQETHRTDTYQLLGELAGGLAHDLNQSLALIAGYADLSLRQLEETQLSTEEVRAQLHLVHAAALRGGATVSRILRFAAQRPEEPFTLIDLRRLLNDVVALTAVRWRNAAQAQGRAIHVRFDARGACLVMGSEPGLQHLFTNLILNAVEALPFGGSIVVLAFRVADTIEIEVCDTGTGMPPEVQGRIFEPYFTTRGARGTGLGLVQIWQTVDRHGGSIDVESSPGHGTTFRLRLPAARAAAPEPARRCGDRRHGGRLLRVLVVDDEPSLARLAATVLRRDGHSVDAVNSASEAIAYLADRTVDIVMSDLGLGVGMNGWTLAAYVKEHWPTMPFVLVTGWGAAIDPAAARAAGADAVVGKPYSLSALREVLQSLCPA
jgi:CheY-like chemotaxis protein